MNSCLINRDFTFYDSDRNPIGIQAIALTLTQKEEEILGCRLSFSVNEQVYQFISQNSLFNLKPEATFSAKKVEFLPETNITLEVELRPDWLAELGQRGKVAEDIANYLIDLDLPTDIESGFNCSENWYCLSVKQQQGIGEVGYQTLWNHINLSQIHETVRAGHKIVESLSSFLKETSDTLTSQLEVLNYTDENSSHNLLQFIESLEEIGSPPSPQFQPISEVMKDFFDEDDWTFVELETEFVLQMAFQGKNGRWTCYACAFEESEQFVFYSVCPLVVPPEQNLAMAEYLMKVNYGLIIGNFELDFTDGEIRYKSSIDVENEQLTTGLVNNLVYTNVLTMDKYLPGITAVINAQLSVDDAIDLVENPLENQTEQE